MTGFAARLRRRRPALIGAVALAAAILSSAAAAQPAAPLEPTSPISPTSPAAPIANSTLDALLFYQLLIGELELSEGRAGNGFGVLLDAARRSGDESLYQRAVEVALQARAGDQSLEATRAWRSAKPESLAARRYQAQILLALNRPDEATEPLAAWLAAVPVIERPGLLASLPRLLQGLADKQRALALTEKLVLPYLDQPGVAVASRVALGRANLAAGTLQQALGLARAAQAAEAGSPLPVMLALDLLPGTPAAEGVITDYLARPDAEPALQLGYARKLVQSQRFADAGRQLERLTRDKPSLPEPWLSLGALRLELKRPAEAEASLLRYVELVTAAAPASPTRATPEAVPANPAEAGPDDDDDAPAASTSGGPADLTAAWLLLSQAAEQRGDVKAAEAWLAKVDSPQRLLDVQTRRASLLARQGKVKEARALIQAVPERTGDDARAKLMAEAQLLRDIKRWPDAAEVLAAASERFKDDTDLVYEQAMVAEKQEHWPEMEQWLRRVIALKPDHPHAHNALGYSFADRSVRLPEARELIQHALQLAPGDPFITDSLGWVEFRLGNRDEALRLLRQAHGARPDTEIAAHLGEVLWATGQHDEARSVWQEARGRDGGNEVLRETLARLKVKL